MPARRKVNRSNDDIMPRHHDDYEKNDRSEYVAEVLPHGIPQRMSRRNNDIMTRHHGHSEKIDRSEYIAEILPHDIPRAKSRYKVREAASESSSERSLKQMIRDECC